MALSDWELWACAQEVIRQQKEKARPFADARIAALREAGDAAGVAAWEAIAARIDQLSDLGSARPKDRDH